MFTDVLPKVEFFHLQPKTKKTNNLQNSILSLLFGSVVLQQRQQSIGGAVLGVLGGVVLCFGGAGNSTHFSTLPFPAPPLLPDSLQATSSSPEVERNLLLHLKYV